MSTQERDSLIAAISTNTKCLDLMNKNIVAIVARLEQQKKLIHELQRELAKYQVDRDMG